VGKLLKNVPRIINPWIESIKWAKVKIVKNETTKKFRNIVSEQGM
jgi:hypothetical protein